MGNVSMAYVVGLCSSMYQCFNALCSVCPLPVNVHPDSCIDSVVGALEKGSMICPRIKDGQASFYIIRYAALDYFLFFMK